ncbi:MAG: Nif3-like dinuclear metal center hexameric protein [Dysgonamonadaceae bacterium]|nr:Nif3-like dinuclear metal center hexameric protein [Dysgonamonadaceae bacterium]
MKIKEIISEIEKHAPLMLQESYDNAGIQVGDVNQQATGALLCLDVVESIIDEACERNCNLIISHHPLIFNPLKSLTGKNYIERCIIKAIQKGIVIYSAHTNLDNAVGGINYKLAEKIGLQNVQHISEQIETGVVGELTSSLSEQSFLHHLKDIFHTGSLKYSPLRNKDVKKIAVCGGSGSFLIPDAIALGADVFITGEAKYNDYYNVENNILLVVIGHYESEVCTKEIFFEIITKKFPNFAVHFSNVNSNPVNYL